MSEIEQQSQPRPVNNPIAGSKRNPYTLWFVVLAFTAPVALAYIMYFFVDVKSFVNHGEILDPIVNITSFELKDEDGTIVPEDKLIHKWRLVSFLGKECEQACQKRLLDSRQIHRALGKEQYRVLRMFVHLQPADEALSKLGDEVHPDVIHVNGDAEVIVKALGKNVHDNVGIDDNEIYIMDPLGNVMMRFTQDQPNKDFLHDLQKLLKVSQIG